MGMNGALAGPSTSHFKLSGVFDLSDLEICEVYCISKKWNMFIYLLHK